MKLIILDILQNYLVDRNKFITFANVKINQEIGI